MIIQKSSEDSPKITSNALLEGKVVIIPTDTVYGFSGIVDLLQSKSFYNTDSKIRKIKGREENKPLIQLISRPEDIYRYTDENLPDTFLSYWPGPLTVIVRVKDGIYPVKTETVAFRCPGDLWLRKIIEECNAPVFSTSVNRSGFPVIEEIESIVKEFSDEVPVIVSDGDKKGSLPSTIVSFTDGEIKILRQGAVVIK